MTLTEEKQRVRAILKDWGIITEVLTTPIVYHPGGWEDTVSEELKRQVIQQRIEKLVNGGWDEATDAEVLCYLMTASLVQPFNRDWHDIYLYEAATLMPQIRQAIPGTPTELSDYLKSELSNLKRRIRDSQIRRRKSNRKETDMAKRKLVLEEHETSVLVGIMQDGCDPVIRTVDGALEDALDYVPKFLGEANEEWAVSPKKPPYTPPAAPKPVPAAAVATSAPPEKAEDLPLLSGTGPEQPAEAKVEEQAPASAEEQAEVPAEAPTEAVAEEKVAEAEAEVTEPQAAPAEIKPEPEVPPAELSQEVKERLEVASDSELSQPPVASAAPAPSTPAKPGEWEYYLQDGHGPFETVQLAMDALGLDANNRPQHNRWDRLSTDLKEKIQRRPKA